MLRKLDWKKMLELRKSWISLTGKKLRSSKAHKLKITKLSKALNSSIQYIFPVDSMRMMEMKNLNSTDKFFKRIVSLQIIGREMKASI
jgi:hypothetical protein